MKPTKLPSGAWRCRVYLGKDANGKRIYESITRLDYYECLEDASRLAKHHHESERDSSFLTLAEAMDRYIDMKSNVLSQSTIRNYVSIRKNHLQPEMELPLRKISSTVAQQGINREAASNSAKTVSNIYHLLTAVVGQFSDRKLNVTLPEPREKTHNTLTNNQIRTLIEALRGDNSEIPLLLALFLGLRRSEAMALTHEDYDSELRVVTINKAMVPNKNGEFVVKQTKTKTSRRVLPVPAYLAERLDDCVEKGISFYPVAPERPYKRLQKLCDKYHLPKMTMHDLRHQNASIMLALGVPDKYAMERGGWSSNATMKYIYQHTMSEQRLETDRIINDYFQSLIE